MMKGKWKLDFSTEERYKVRLVHLSQELQSLGGLLQYVYTSTSVAAILVS